MPRARLGDGSWQLEEDNLAALRAKIKAGRKTLGEVYGPPLNGIKTGLNEAFIVSQERRDELIARDPRSAELLVPFLRGENIKRWRIEGDDLWLLNIEFGWTKKRFARISATADNNREVEFWRALGQTYPAVADHLAPFEQKARVRTDQGQYWWELRACSYLAVFGCRKLIWPQFQATASFFMDDAGVYLNNKAFFIPNPPFEELGLLNSNTGWFLLANLARVKRGGYVEAEAQYVQQLPSIADASTSRAVGSLAERCNSAAMGRAWKIETVLRRIPDLCPSDRAPKLTTRLQDWWKLDFKSFQAEIKKAFKADIPLKQRNEWENFLREEGEKVRRLTAEVEQAEREIDTIVYTLFNLTAEDIALLENSLAGQY